MNEEKGKSRCSDGGRILECDYFITGNSNPAFVPLAAQAHVISNKNRRKAIFNWAAKGLFFLRFKLEVFRYSFSEAIPMFFNLLKSVFFLVRSL